MSAPTAALNSGGSAAGPPSWMTSSVKVTHLRMSMSVMWRLVPREWSRHQQSAVDVQDRARHVAAFRPQQEEHGGDDVLGLADAAERDRGRACGFVEVGEVVEHRRPDRAGRDGVD